jgi:hypothetical protein
MAGEDGWHTERGAETGGLLMDQELALDFDEVMERARAFIDAAARERAVALAHRTRSSADPRAAAASRLVTALVHLAEGSPQRAIRSLKPLDRFSDPDIAAEVFLIRGQALDARGMHADADANYRLAMALPRPVTAGLAALRLVRTALALDDLPETARLLHLALHSPVPAVRSKAEQELSRIRTEF